jgi:hypothetical protein
MSHPSEERLILSRYEADRGVARHLAGCLPCRGRMNEIERLLALVESAPVPERGPAYGREVWSRLAPRLTGELETPVRRFFAPRLAFAGALAAVALVAFLAGRFWRAPQTAPAAAVAAASRASQRILLVTIGDHLEKSEAVLVELLHPAGEPGTPAERERVEELLAANRLYRQSASSAGERSVSDVLDDLERVLLEAAHRPDSAAQALEDLRRRAEAEGVLFKVRVLGSRVRQREEAIAPRNERKTI